MLLWLAYGAANAQEQKGTADGVCGVNLVNQPVSDDGVKIQLFRATNNMEVRYHWKRPVMGLDSTCKRL